MYLIFQFIQIVSHLVFFLKSHPHFSMLAMYLSLLFIFWAILWSFSSVIIYRLRTWEKWIFTGRSKCPKCQHMLGFFDLFPVFSYIASRGKCRYCSTKISIYYPSLELSLGMFFVSIGYFLTDISLILSWNIYEIWYLIFFLFVSFLAFIYTVYDILYLEIPESVLLTLVVWIFLWLALLTFLGWIDIITISSIIISGMILGLLYLIMLGWLEEKYDVAIFLWSIALLLAIKNLFDIRLSDYTMFHSLIWALAIFWFFFAQIIVSKGKWMWWWDLRIALVIGLLLGYSYWLPGLMITYFTGSLIGVWYIIYSRYIKKDKEMVHQIPFGPFLTIWLFMTLFFQEEIDAIITAYFIL